MVKFRAPVLEDKSRVDEILSKADFEGSLYSFAAIYTWAERYHTKIAFYNDALLVSGYSDSVGLYFLYPVGEYQLGEVLSIMRCEAQKHNSKLRIIAERRQAEELYSCFRDEFEINDARDEWDYVYNTEDLAFLRGNRYHGKRNHISRLAKRNAGSQFYLEPINENNIALCMEIEQTWIKEKADDSDLESVSRALLHMDYLGLSGGVLRMDGKAIAFTVGEPLLDDTFIIHIEKSLPGYDGAYQMINQYFAKTLVGKYQFINREEDMGIDGLRTSKLSYLPCRMIEKCVIAERT